MDSPQSSESRPDEPNGAQGLREQAAACRRLAAGALTKAGTTSMNALADHFEDHARKIDETVPVETNNSKDVSARQGAAK